MGFSNFNGFLICWPMSEKRCDTKFLWTWGHSVVWSIVIQMGQIQIDQTLQTNPPHRMPSSPTMTSRSWCPTSSWKHPSSSPSSPASTHSPWRGRPSHPLCSRAALPLRRPKRPAVAGNLWVSRRRLTLPTPRGRPRRRPRSGLFKINWSCWKWSRSLWWSRSPPLNLYNPSWSWWSPSVILWGLTLFLIFSRWSRPPSSRRRRRRHSRAAAERSREGASTTRPPSSPRP